MRVPGRGGPGKGGPGAGVAAEPGAAPSRRKKPPSHAENARRLAAIAPLSLLNIATHGIDRVQGRP